jgi:MORN repeat variant
MLWMACAPQHQPRRERPPIRTGWTYAIFRTALLMLPLAAAALGQDSLYWGCDTTSREYQAEFEKHQGLELPVYEPGEACDPQPEMVRAATEGGSERFNYCLQGYLKVKDGPYESRYPTGHLRWQGTYSHDKKAGEWREWYPSGKRKSVSYYVKGRLEGLSREFHPNGKVMDEYKYHDGRIDCRNGYHRSYYRNGSMKVDFGLKDGRLVRYVFYDSHGKVMRLPVILKP